MAWSEAQAAAIEIRDKNLLVAAAAGSGKTSVLVERIIRRILDETAGFEMDQVLVVTFTNAAAAEMRERVGGALSKALRENPRSRHLERQLALLNSASISTLHAFCQGVIRQNFHLLDLDPKFRLANEQETRLLRYDVLEALFEKCYAAGDEDFLNFVDHYGSERGDEALYEILLKLYEFSRSQPCPDIWLQSLPTRFFMPEDTSIDDSVWARLLKREMRLIFMECASRSEELLQEAECFGFDFYAPVLEADKALFEKLLALTEGDWDALRAAVCAAQFQILRAPRDADETQKAFFVKKRNQLKDKLKQVKEHYLIADGMELLEDLGVARPMLETICRLTAEFADVFAEAKKSRAIVDFSDLEHFCLRILRAGASESERLTPSAASLALQEKYHEVMVDEYQDTNGVQEAILSLVRRPEPNLFLVGDVKQSIYRFRLADPALFLEKYRAYPRGGEAFARVDLAQNFRSRGGVLAAINFVFSQVMSPEVAELSYDAAQRLNPGPVFPDTERRTVAGPVELCLLDKDDTPPEPEPVDEDSDEAEECRGFAVEAQFIAARIQRLMEEDAVVFDKEKKEYRSLLWRDIVILLRSVKGKADVLLETLRNNGIPAYASVDGGYFQEIEVQVVLALLQIIDNPRQDIPLASVLYSPVVGMSAEALAKLRLLEPDGVLLEALLKASDAAARLPERTKEQAVDFIVRLNRWRSLARRRSVPELIWQLLRDTGYYDYVGALPGGALRQANLRMLYDRAREYEATNFRGLFRFLRFVEKMRGAGTDLSVARMLGESENVVRIMSIHKSKGLEFPVVIAADLGKRFNLQDSRAAMLIHKELGLGPCVTNAAFNLRYPTVARLAIAAQMNRESKAEELRVLYVALTRAREKLILVGSVAKLAARAKDWGRFADRGETLLPDYAIAGAQSYLDWLCPAVARHDCGAPLRDYGDVAATSQRLVEEEPSQWQIKILTSRSVTAQTAEEGETPALLDKIARGELLPDSPKKTWVEAVLNWRYAYEAAQTVPAKLSVTEMKRRFASLDELAAPLFKPPTIAARPRFVRQSTRLTGAEYGTLMHSVMQHVDLDGDLSEAGLRAQLDGFVEREIVLPEHAAFVDLESVRRFFSGEIGLRMRAASKVRRELPFSVMLPAGRFYPDVTEEAERIFIQGIVDVLFDEADGMVLVDYKTDGGHDEREMAERYQLQLTLYAEAIEKIFNRRVKERYLYLFSTGKIVAV